MRRKALASSTALAAFAAALVPSEPALAQQQDQPPDYRDEGSASQPSMPEIIVTAQRKSQSIYEVPLAVQALGQSALKDLRIDDVNSLATAVPGLSVAPAYSGVPIFTLRGIGFNTVNITATSTVGIYQDELAYPYPSMAGGPIFDLERVEVLKGPQGTLYGRNTTAGLIDFITAKPQLDTFAGRIQGEFGNYQTYNLEGMVNLPLGDVAALRVSGRWENSDKGWQVDQLRGDRLGEKDRLAGRVSLLFEPGSDFSAYASLSGWRDRSDTQAGQAISLNLTNRLSLGSPSFGPGDANVPGLLDYLENYQPSRARDAGFNTTEQLGQTIGLAPGIGAPRADSDFLSAQLRLTWSPNERLRIISISGYNDFSRKDVVDFSGAPFEIIATRYDAAIKSFQQEVRAEVDGDGFDWTIGGYFAHDTMHENTVFLIGENSSVRYLRLATLGLLADPVANAVFNTSGFTAADVVNAFRAGGGRSRGKAETMSAFMNGEVELGARLKLSGGMRLGIDKTELDGCSTEVNGNYLPIVNTTARAIIFSTYGVIAPEVIKGGCTTYDPVTNTDHEVHSQLSQNNFSGRLALQYEPSDDSLLFASVARGIKSGNIPIVPANRAVQFTPASQEKLTAYELGARLGLWGHRAQINVTGFYYDYTDKQFSSYVPDPTFGALQRLVNIPRSRAWGIDGEIVLQPIPELSLNWNATYLDTRVKDYTGANAAGIPTDFSGSDFSFAPKFSTSGTAVLTVPLSSTIDFRTTLNGSYQSKTHSDFGEDPLFAIKDYFLLNGSIGIQGSDGSWSLSLWGRNITNTYYWTSVVDNQNLNVRYAGMPRTYGMTLSYGF
ncbi:TonB-dependent receptor [Novosphingobium sp. YJ-S2-02]|uniref:TonB-dependent receptor n=1 Tax=Novosphingobium aureum TaxID=2792964 RepID=A0A931MK07_9SPHN|nr:TonB-dependent receptor [Novosphingobium aureum]MBH0112030.1 TonB-dependent receptor [Novosphingobium aureum]